MKCVLLSIQPYYCFLIIAKEMGWNIKEEKTIEVRKSFPQDKDWNKKVIIYCSQDRKSFSRIPNEYQPLMERFLGKVVGVFICDGIDTYKHITGYICYYDIKSDYDLILQNSCLTYKEFANYGQGKTLYGWHISNLKIYDKPKELSEFKTPPCEKDENYCEKCKFLQIENTPFSYTSYCDRENGKAITRPFQSWGYVEDIFLGKKVKGRN